MKLTTTKTLANELNRECPALTIRKSKLTAVDFKALVDYDAFAHDTDFDYATGMFSVIRVEYPADYCAVDRYITTKDLHRIYKRSNGSWNDFVEEFKNEVMI